MNRLRATSSAAKYHDLLRPRNPVGTGFSVQFFLTVKPLFRDQGKQLSRNAFRKLKQLQVIRKIKYKVHVPANLDRV